MSLVWFVIAVGLTIFYVIPFTVTKGAIVHFMAVFFTLWLGCNQLMIRRSLSLLVMPMFITQGGWNQSLIINDRRRRDALDFCNLSGCEQLVRCPTNIAGNRLDLMMTDVPDIVDVVVGTPLQCVPEYNVRSTASF